MASRDQRRSDSGRIEDLTCLFANAGQGGAGGGGFELGPLPNTFGTVATADMAAARVLLDAQAGGDAAWLAEYDDDRSNYVRLVWTGNATAVLRRNRGGR